MAPKAKSKSQKVNLESLILRLKKSYNVSDEDDDDNNEMGFRYMVSEEASFSLGRNISNSLIEYLLVSIDVAEEEDQTLSRLISLIVSRSSPSCANTFFHTLAENYIKNSNATKKNNNEKSETMTTHKKTSLLLNYWKKWACMTEEQSMQNSSSIGVLKSVIHGLIQILLTTHKNETNSNFSQIIPELHVQLRHNTTKLQLLKQCLQSSKSVNFLMPMLTITFLSSSSSSSKENKGQARIYIERYFLQQRRCHSQSSSHPMELISSNLKLLQIHIYTNKLDDCTESCVVDWLDDILHWTSNYVVTNIDFIGNDSNDSDRDENKDLLSVFEVLNTVLQDVFPLLSGHSTLEDTLQQVVSMLSRLKRLASTFLLHQKNSSSSTLFTDLAIQRLFLSLTLSSNEVEIESYLDICFLILMIHFDAAATTTTTMTDDNEKKGWIKTPLGRLSTFKQKSFWIIGNMFLTSPSSNVAERARKILLFFSHDINKEFLLKDYEVDEVYILSQTYFHNEDMNIVNRDLDYVPPSLQSLLLISICMNFYSLMEKTEYSKDKSPMKFIQLVFEKYPLLGIRFFPVALSHITILYKEDPTKAITILEFLSTSISSDMNCARQIWNLLHNILNSQRSILPSIIIRLYNPLIQANSKFFSKKVSAEMVAHSQSPVAEVRLAVSSTICEICTSGSLSSVFLDDFIGIIQTYLTCGDTNKTGLDSERSMVERELVRSYAIQSLHHLCQDGLMDYRIMMKVLKNRMGWNNGWKSGSLEREHVESIVTTMDTSVLKTLTVLLGDGDLMKVNRTSKQSMDSVKFLIYLGYLLMHREISYNDIDSGMAGNNANHQEDEPGTLNSIRCLIFQSLNNYSFDVLVGINDNNVGGEEIQTSREVLLRYWNGFSSPKDDIDEDDEKQNSQVIMQYAQLCELSLHYLQSDCRFNEGMKMIQSFINKMLKMEQDEIGMYSLWRKNNSKSGFSSNNKTKKRERKEKNTSKVGPGSNNTLLTAIQPTQDLIHILQNHHVQNPSPISATSLMFVLQPFPDKKRDVDDDEIIQTIGAQITELISDLSEQQDKITCPTIKLMAVFSFFSASQRIWCSLSEKSNAMVNRCLGLLKDIKESFLDIPSDAIYLLMSCFGLTLQNFQEHEEEETNIDVVSIVDQIYVSVWDSFDDFYGQDELYLCLGICAISQARMQYWDRVDTVVTELSKKKEEGYFGAYIGLGILCQDLGHSLSKEEEKNTYNSESSMIIKEFVSKIMALLTKELISFLEYSDNDDQLDVRSKHYSHEVLISCIKNDKDIPRDIVEKLSVTSVSFSSYTIHERFKLTRRFQFLQLAIGLAISGANGIVRSEALQAIYIILKQCKAWLALPQALRAIVTNVDEQQQQQQMLDKEQELYEMKRMLHSFTVDDNFAIDQDDGLLLALVNILDISSEESESTKTKEKLLSALLKRISPKDKNHNSSLQINNSSRIMAILSLSSISIHHSCLLNSVNLFSNPAVLQEGMLTHEELTQIMEIISQLGEDECEQDSSREAAIIVLGFIASLPFSYQHYDYQEYLSDTRKISTLSRAKLSSEREDASNIKVKEAQTEMTIKKRRHDLLPKATEGTLTSSIVTKLEESQQEVLSSSSKTALKFLSVSLPCFHDIYLPGAFCKNILRFFLLSPFTADNDTTEFLNHQSLQITCLKVLVNQITIRRRGSGTDQEFINLYIRLIPSLISAYEESKKFTNNNAHMKYLGGYNGVIYYYLESLRFTLPYFPPDTITKEVLNIWSIILKDSSSVDLSINFLQSIKHILQYSSSISATVRGSNRNSQKNKEKSKNIMSRASLSSDAMNSVHKLLTSDLFDSLMKKNLDNSSTKVWYAYYDCLLEIPASTLLDDTMNFFLSLEDHRQQTQELLYKAKGMMYLIHHGYFEKNGIPTSQKVFELSRLKAWLARRRCTTTKEDNEPSYASYYDSTSLNMLLDFVKAEHFSAKQQHSKKHHKENILYLLDVMLVDGLDNFCIPLLALQIAYCWSSYYNKKNNNLTVSFSRIENVSSLSSCYLASASVIATEETKKSTTSTAPNTEIFVKLCLRDLPIKLGLISQDLGIVGKVFSKIHSIVDNNNVSSVSKATSTQTIGYSHLKILQDALIYCPDEENNANWLRYVTFVSSYLSKK